MRKYESLISEAKEKMELLNFEECIILHDRLPKGHVLRNLACDRMEKLDIDRFDLWLDERLGL